MKKALQWTLFFSLLVYLLTSMANCYLASNKQYTVAQVNIRELSGIVASHHAPELFWGLADSGNPPALVVFRINGEILAQFSVKGAQNMDWEDIARDGQGHLFIGDIGNNRNTREYLTIYQIKEPLLSQDQPTSLAVEKTIHVRFPEWRQTRGNNHNFDAESLFWYRDHLYLLSKHRADTKTILYRVPKSWEQESEVILTLEQIAETEIGGKVTAADIRADGHYLAVLGYHGLFIFALSEHEENLFQHLAQKTIFSQKITRQCEAVAWDGDKILFANEDGDLFAIPQPLLSSPSTFPSHSISD